VDPGRTDRVIDVYSLSNISLFLFLCPSFTYVCTTLVCALSGVLSFLRNADVRFEGCHGSSPLMSLGCSCFPCHRSWVLVVYIAVPFRVPDFCFGPLEPVLGALWACEDPCVLLWVLGFSSTSGASCLQVVSRSIVWDSILLGPQEKGISLASGVSSWEI